MEKIRPRHMAKAVNFMPKYVSFMRGKVSWPASGTAFLYNCGRILYRVFRSTNSLPWGLGFHEHLTSLGAHAAMLNK